MSGHRITSLAETAFPLEVNSLFVGDDGELQHIDPREQPFSFSFVCLGAKFAATTRVRQGKLWLRAAAKLGPVPYTAESSDRRRDALAIMRASAGLPHGQVSLSRDGQIELSGELQLAEPLTPVNVVSAAAELVLEIKPYLTLVADLIQPKSPRAAAGS